MLLHSVSDNDKFRKDVTKYIFALESELKKLDTFKAAQVSSAYCATGLRD